MLIIAVAVSLLAPCNVLAQSGNNFLPNPAAEQWVLEQTALGNVAYLATQFPNEEDRVLSVDFLENLLENPPITVTRYGIRIQDAVFNELLDLQYIKVEYELWLDNSQFNSDVDLSSSQFSSNLSFDGSVFNASATFDEMNVEGDVFLNSVVFEGPVSFRYAQMISLGADEARFNYPDEEAGFSDLKADDVFLDGAVFAGPVDFGYGHFRYFYANDAQFMNKEQEADFIRMKVDGGTFLNRAVFSGPVDFGYGLFGNLYANDARFINKGQEVNFFRMKVDSEIVLNGAVFSGPVDFDYAQVGNLDANGVQFISPEEGITFSSMKVDGGASLNNAVFAGPVNFGYSHFAGFLSIDDAQFTNPEQEANFSVMIVDGALFLNRTVFAGPVKFDYAQMESFNADDVQFTNPQQGASLSVMKVDGGIFLNRAIFFGPVNFSGTQIGLGFYAQQAQFNNPDNVASFDSIKMEENMVLSQASFAGPVSFQSAQIRGIFYANQAQFNSTTNEANFRRMNIEGDLSLEKAIFAGPASFIDSVVLSNFHAVDARFKNVKYPADLRGMNVAGVTNFHRTFLAGGAYFDGATFLDLKLYGNLKDPPIHILTLNQTIVNRELSFESIRVRNMSAKSLRVYGAGFIRNTIINNYADFENSNFAGLMLQNVNWPSRSENILLGGMSYQNLQIIQEENKDAWRELLRLVNRSNYNAQTYTTLENYFLQQGQPERADDVYVAYKRRERLDALSWHSAAWWWNLFLDGFVLYGRSPARALIWSFLFILVGVFVFRKPEWMVSSSKQEIIGPTVGTRGTLSRKLSMRRARSSVHEIPYNPLWYSLDLFLPFIDLGFDDKWLPKPERKWALAYSKIHMLAGWVLIPIGLLTITGIIK